MIIFGIVLIVLGIALTVMFGNPLQRTLDDEVQKGCSPTFLLSLLLTTLMMAAIAVLILAGVAIVISGI